MVINKRQLLGIRCYSLKSKLIFLMENLSSSDKYSEFSSFKWAQRSNGWNEDHFVDSITGPHLSRRQNIRAFGHSTVSSLPQNRAFICFTSHWMYPMYGYSHTHTHIYVYESGKWSKRGLRIRKSDRKWRLLRVETDLLLVI